MRAPGAEVCVVVQGGGHLDAVQGRGTRVRHRRAHVPAFPGATRRAELANADASSRIPAGGVVTGVETGCDHGRAEGECDALLFWFSRSRFWGRLACGHLEPELSGRFRSDVPGEAN
jgi:hypothetical protein